MAEEKNKNQKKLVFSGMWVCRYDKPANQKRATRQEWQLIKTIHHAKPFPWLDCFLIFPDWLRGKQERDYKSLFWKVACEAPKYLNELGILGAKVQPYTRKLDCYELRLPNNLKLESNITEAVKLANQARQKFLSLNQTDTNLGWDLVQKAYEEWPDPKSISEAIAIAEYLPRESGKYQEFLDKIKDLLEDYQDTLLQALTKVLSLAVEERQGIKRDIALRSLTGWIEQYFRVDEALELLAGHITSQPTISDKQIAEFIHLANML